MDWLEQIWLFREVIRPLMDITILSFLIYQTYKILVQTQAVQLLKGIFIIAILYVMAFFFQLDTLLWIMNSLGTVFVIIVAIVFQPELRGIFMRIGKGEWFRFGTRSNPHQLDSIINAADVLSSRRRGCLIVFGRRVGLKNYIETGTKINADLSTSLILTIFAHDTALHDGAVVVRGDKIISAGSFLPLSEQTDIRRNFGTRHRAALGMVEETDAVVLIVSEETGAVSLAYDANLYYDLELDEVKDRMKEVLQIKEAIEEEGEDRSYDE